MKIYETFELIRKSNFDARRRNDYDKLLENAQAISDYIPEIIDILVTQENLYRKYESDILDVDEVNGRKITSAVAETKSKATDYYKEFKRAELTLDWAYATINISKKIASSVTNEFKSTLK